MSILTDTMKRLSLLEGRETEIKDSLRGCQEELEECKSALTEHEHEVLRANIQE